MPDSPVTVALRIPGLWTHPQELATRLPDGWRLTPETLFLPDGTAIGFGAMKADSQFAEIFHSFCREPATDAERNTVDHYTMNALLSGPGGSMTAALTTMKAASAIMHAGGAGVFIDNSMLAHGGQCWQDMTDDGSPDALSFAFVTIIRGKAETTTMGMHVLGFRDIVMKRADVETGGFDIVEMIRYAARNDKPIDDGHIIADQSGPRFRVIHQSGGPRGQGTPMHNPFGRMKLVSLRDLAEAN